MDMSIDDDYEPKSNLYLDKQVTFLPDENIEMDKSVLNNQNNHQELKVAHKF